MRVTPFAGGSPRPSLPPGRSTSLPALATSSGPTAAAAAANDGPRELFLAFYAMTHRDEPELVERVRQYVADGGDLNVRDKTGWGYLNYAAFNNWLEVAQALLESRADPNLTDDSGYTPLHWAVKHESEAMVGMLMEFGADPCSRNLFGKTPVQLASPPIQHLIRQYLEDPEIMDPFPLACPSQERR